MFQIVVAGNEQAAPKVLAALHEAGFPAQVATDCAGFGREPLTVFIEALGSEETLADVCELVAAHGWALRLHGEVEAPRVVLTTTAAADVVAELLARIEKLEAR